MTPFLGYWIFIAGAGTGWLLCAILTGSNRDE